MNRNKNVELIFLKASRLAFSDKSHVVSMQSFPVRMLNKFIFALTRMEIYFLQLFNISYSGVQSCHNFPDALPHLKLGLYEITH